MFLDYRRVGALTTLLCFAASTAALANITIEPSKSVTLVTRVKGMGGDPEREAVTITATTSSEKLELTSNHCKDSGLVTTNGVKTGLTESSGSGRSSERERYVSIRLLSKAEPGQCTLSFSDGSHTATVHVRIEKP